MKPSTISIFIVVAIASVLSGCSHQSIIPPQSQGGSGPVSQSTARNPGGSAATRPAWGLVSNGGSMHSFSDAKGLALKTDADYANFVDPEVVGTDRLLAIALLKFMPPGMRGDFIYVSKSGRVLSNRIALESRIRFQASSSSINPAPLANLGGRSVRPMAYPPTGGSGGPYIRYYSYQGVNAAYGYASFPCDSVYNNSGGAHPDDGNMYFNAYDANGNDVLDAGVAQGSFPDNSQTESAFVNLGGGNYFYQNWNGYTGWTNESQTWQCGIPPFGTPLGIMYGTLPASLSSGSQNLSFLGVGVPDYDPTQMQLPPSSSSWSHAAWTFFDTPPGLLGSAGTWNGIPSPCMFCSVGRMLTIAQSTPASDGSCFGACSGTPTARWDQVVMGEIIAPCAQNSGSPPSATCTIEYQSNGAWQNGANDSCDGTFYSEYNQQNALEGINLNYTGGCQATTTSQGQFKSPLPIAPSSPCTADSYGYCSVVNSTAISGVCQSGYTYVNGHEIPVFVRAYNRTYYTFKKEAMLELQGTATEYESVPSDPPCTITTSWSPAEPRVTYNDSNLP